MTSEDKSGPVPSPPTITTVRFVDLAHHLEEQIRGSTDGGTVNRYRLAMRAGEAFPPILVAEVAGALILVDGFHRRDAYEALGWEEAPAVIIACRDLKEAQWEGFRANLRHGQPLKPKLLRPALRAYIRAGENRWPRGRPKSYREMAGDVPGVSHSTVRRWIEEDFPKLFAEMGGGEGDAPGGLPKRPQTPTAEEALVEQARAYIAEARALLRGASGDLRRRVAGDVQALLVELTWDGEAETFPDPRGWAEKKVEGAPARGSTAF